jgi:hypothetical protein
MRLVSMFNVLMDNRWRELDFAPARYPIVRDRYADLTTPFALVLGLGASLAVIYLLVPKERPGIRVGAASAGRVASSPFVSLNSDSSRSSGCGREQGSHDFSRALRHSKPLLR